VVEPAKGEEWKSFVNRHGDWGRDLVFYLARGKGFVGSWCGVLYMQSEEDAKLLDLAGEVARELKR